MVSDDFILRMNISISVIIVILLTLLEIFSKIFSISFNVFSKWFVSLMITILSYLILNWYKSGNIELLKTVSLLFILQSFIYLVLNVTIRQVVDLEKKVPQSIFRLCIAGIFTTLWISFASVIWRSELNYVILIPVSLSFIVFMLSNVLKLANQEIPQNDYSTKIMNTLDRYNSTPLKLIINLHLWCIGVYLFHEILV